MLQNTN